MAEENRPTLASLVRSPHTEGRTERLGRASALPPAAIEPPKDETSFSLLGGTDSTRLGSFIGSVSGMAGRGLASVPEALEIATTGIYNLAQDTNFSADDFYNPMLDGSSDLIKGFFNTIAQENPEYAHEAQSALGRGLGSVGSSIVGGALSAGAKGLARLGVSTGIAAAQLGVEGVEDYRATVEAQGNLSDGRKEFQTFAATLPLAALEMLSLKGMFRTFDKAVGGSLDNMVGDALQQGSVEAATEALQNIGSDLIARDLIAYDPDREMFQATKESAAVGGGVGAIVSIISSLLGGRIRTSNLHNESAPAEMGPLEKTLLTTGISRKKATLSEQQAENKETREALANLNPVTNQELSVGKVKDLQLEMDKARALLPEATGSNKQFLEDTIARYEAELDTMSKEDSDAITRQEASDVLKGEDRSSPRSLAEEDVADNPEAVAEAGTRGDQAEAAAEEEVEPVGKDGETFTEMSDRSTELKDKIAAAEASLKLDEKKTDKKKAKEDKKKLKAEAKAAGLTVTKYKETLRLSNKNRKAELKALESTLAAPKFADLNRQESARLAEEEQAETAALQEELGDDEVVGETALDLPLEGEVEQPEAVNAVNDAYEPVLDTTDPTSVPDENLINTEEETSLAEEPEAAQQAEVSPNTAPTTEPSAQQAEEEVSTAPAAQVSDDVDPASQQAIDATRAEARAIAEDLVDFNEVIVSAVGKPFKNPKSAKNALKRKGLDTDQYEVTEVDGGYAITVKPDYAPLDGGAHQQEAIHPGSVSQADLEAEIDGIEQAILDKSDRTEGKTTVKRAPNFSSEGEYEVVLANGETFHISRDTQQFSSPTWHVTELPSVTGVANTKAEAIAFLENRAKGKASANLDLQKAEPLIPQTSTAPVVAPTVDHKSFDYISEQATDTSGMTIMDSMVFHAFNPNGKMQQLKDIDTEVRDAVNAGTAPPNSLLAYGSLNSSAETTFNALKGKKRVTTIQRDVALDAADRHIADAREFLDGLSGEPIVQESPAVRIDNIVEGNATNSTTASASASNALIESLQGQIQDNLDLGRPTTALEMRLEREQALLDRNLKTQEDLLEREERAEAGTTRTMSDAQVEEAIERLEAGENVDLEPYDSIIDGDSEAIAYGESSDRFPPVQPGEVAWATSVEIDETTTSTLMPNGRRRYNHPPGIMAKITALIDKFDKGVSKFGGRVVLVQDPRDLPLELKRALLRRKKTSNVEDIGTQGLVARDKNDVSTIYIIANRNPSLADIRIALVHEAVGHFGFRNMFEAASGEGPSTFSHFLEKEAQRNPRLLQEAINLVTARGYRHLFSDTRTDTATMKVTVGDQVMFLSPANAGIVMNEFIAFSTEHLLIDPNFETKYGGLRKRLLAAARHMFRKIGFLPKDLTKEDIFSLISESNRRLFDLGNASAVGFLQQGRGVRYMLSKYTDKLSPDASAEAMAIHGVAPNGSHASEQVAVEVFEMDSTPLQKDVAKQEEAKQDVMIKRSIELIRNGSTDIAGKGVMDKWTNAVEGWGKTIAEMPLVKKMDGLRRLGSLGKLKDKALYRFLGTEARSFIAKGESVTKNVVKVFDKMNSSQKEVTLAYFTSKEGPSSNVSSIPNLTKVQQDSLRKSKEFIIELGDELVGLGVLKAETHKQSAGTYLPQMYYKYFTQGGGASGKRVSFMGYLRKQKQLHVHESTELGRIKDPSIIVPETIGTIARDIALMKMTKNIAEFSGKEKLGWVLGEAYKVKVKSITGKPGLTNVYQLGLDIDRLKEQLKDGQGGDLLGYTQEMGNVISKRIQYLTDLEAAAVELKFREVDDLMENLGTDRASITPEMRTAFIKQNYKEMPKDRAYGALSGKLVLKAIHNDYVDTILVADGVDATLQWGHQIWKASKVVWNVPVSTIRNSAGNFALLDMSTNTNSAKLSKWVYDEIVALGSDKGSRWLRYANETGVNGTTFSSNELNLVRRTIKGDLKMAVALEKRVGTKMHKPMAFGISMSKTALNLSNTLSEFYGFQEGIFKAVKMRDYIQTWEEQNKVNLDDVKLDPALRKAVLLEAANRANDAIFDYGEVPDFIKWARKYPFIGSPFVTFMYKSALKMPENLVKHPQKFIKYQAVTSVAAMSLLGAYADWGDDEAEEVLRKLPTYYDNNSSIIVLPFKDDNGRPQFIDMSVFFPYAPHVNMMKGVLNEMSAGRPSAAATEMLNWTGLLGAPAFSLGAAIKTNKDPFTGRDIVPDGATPQQTLSAIGTYAFSFVMPPVLTERGGIGHLLDNAGIDAGPFSTGRIVNKLGTDKETLGQASMRLFGINAVPADKDLSTKNTRASRDFELRKLNAVKNKIRKEPEANVSAEDKATKLRAINAQIKAVRQKFQEKLN